ncbi:MAG TPA: S8 family serine peptidase [Candidatus Binatia bacterium]|nr:S8 family serine peptidase [Candidatus Binatia bacterium]
MRAPRRSAAALLVVAVAGAAAFVLLRSGAGAQRAGATGGSWRGFVGDPRPDVQLGQRMIVVLKAPSVGERLVQARYATEAQERSWTPQALAAQQQVLTTLAAAGIGIHPDYTFERVLDGFSATLDPRAVALLQRDPYVAGVYPVRAAFPASTASSPSLQSSTAPGIALPGFDGRGVTIALLDTGVDLAHSYLRGHVLPGVDVVGSGDDASARADPQDSAALERHGTELAGILVGANGPGGLHGVAPGATLLPIRVAGWQPDVHGDDVVYARSDQLIAGLERAVDPNRDGDCHDAARVALIGVAEPYAAFADGPEAQAVQGALDLNTVVVAPAGNDGAAGPTFGSVSGPAGSPAAVAVAATDSRSRVEDARVVLRRGLDIVYDREQPLLGPVTPHRALTLAIAAPRAGGANGADFFDARGNSLVAGKAAVAPLGADPQGTAAAAASAGAAAVVFYGPAASPAGALRVTQALTIPVAWVPASAAVELLAAKRAGLDVGIAIGSGRAEPDAQTGFVAGFSSHGLAFDGRVKPDIAAPGVAIATSEPGDAPDGSSLFGTVNGTSGAAATVAGAAALLAQMRPNLNGPELRSLLVGYAEPGRAPAVQVGAGTFRVGASAVGEVAADQATLGFGIWRGPHWHATRTLILRNVSTRRLQLSVAAFATAGESEELHFRVEPNHLVLREGRAKRLQVTVTSPAAPPSPVVTGVIQASPAGGVPLRVPWALEFQAPSTAGLLQRVTLDHSAFKPSDTSPAILSVQAGNVVAQNGVQIDPVSRLDILLYTAAGRFVGVMARLRDLLPGAYSFGITGRGPNSIVLAAGDYELRLAAWPTLPTDAKPTRAIVRFRIQ